MRKSTDPVPNEPSVADALEVESAKRAVKGSWIYPFIACVVVLTSDMVVSHRFISALFIAALGGAGWSRWVWARRALAHQGKDAYRRLRLSVAAQGGVWGCFVATIFYYYNFSSVSWFALTLSAGFVAGGTSSLGIHRQLHRSFMVSMGLPVALGMLAVDWSSGLTLGVVASILVYCGFLLRDANHQMEAYLDLWRAQEELRVARDQARAADRAKSSFLAMMSHEIRTPMHAAVGSASMLLETELDAEQRRYAHTIVHAGETLVGLINDILDLSRMQEHGLNLECEDFALHQALSETMQMFEPLARRAGLDFRLSTHRAAQRLVYGDKRRLQQILVNLIGNAIKFTERGFVRVEINSEEREGAVIVRFSVQDSGIGIAQEQLERIFLPFEQADFGVARKFGGSGLGLAICHRLADAMQGRIEVTSAPEQGTRFDVELRLMAAQASAEPSTPPEQPEMLRLSSQLRVLVVDDSALNRAVAKQMLERLGCEASLCESGEAALQKLKLESFDIVLMDCQMRGLDGYATTRRLRTLSKALSILPVIAVTANAFEDDRKAALEAGMNDLLAKPFGLQDLERLLIRWTRALREPSIKPKVPARLPVPGPRLVNSGTSMYPKALHNIAQLLGVEMGSPTLDGPVSGFLNQWEQRCQQMCAAIASSDVVTLRQVVHALEGGIPYLGSEQLNLALQELQKHTRAGDMRAAAAAANEISALIDELARSRDKHLAKTHPKLRLR